MQEPVIIQRTCSMVGKAAVAPDDGSDDDDISIRLWATTGKCCDGLVLLPAVLGLPNKNERVARRGFNRRDVALRLLLLLVDAKNTRMPLTSDLGGEDKEILITREGANPQSMLAATG